MKRVFIIVLILLHSLLSFGEMGKYRIKKVIKGKTFKIPNRASGEEWKFIKLFNLNDKPIVEIYSRLEIEGPSGNLCKYIKNLTNKKLRFYLVFELRYILVKAYKIILPPKGKIGPICNRIYFGGTYETIQWGAAIYEKWLSKTNNSGKGIITYF